MRYLTKEWDDLCQHTFLHIDMRADDRASEYSEDLYQELYKISENEHVGSQHRYYDCDPRCLLDSEGTVGIPLHKFLSGEELTEEDYVVIHIPEDHKEDILRRIEEFDARPPFDEKKCREEFQSMQPYIEQRKVNEIRPYGLLNQIADTRVYGLGYCTEEILQQLISISQQNHEEVNRIMKECDRALELEKIPKHLRETFGFHDCKVIEYKAGENISLSFDTSAGFTPYNKVTFVTPKIIKCEEHIVGNSWLYEELYCTESGYEAHMLFGGVDLPELIISCEDIIVEIE